MQLREKTRLGSLSLAKLKFIRESEHKSIGRMFSALKDMRCLRGDQPRSRWPRSQAGPQ